MEKSCLKPPPPPRAQVCAFEISAATTRHVPLHTITLRDAGIMATRAEISYEYVEDLDPNLVSLPPVCQNLCAAPTSDAT